MDKFRQIRVCCSNTERNKEILELMGYRFHLLFNNQHKLWCLNIWTLEASALFRQESLLLTTEHLMAIAMIPTIYAVEQFIYTLQDDALKEMRSNGGYNRFL